MGRILRIRISERHAPADLEELPERTVSRCTFRAMGECTLTAEGRNGWGASAIDALSTALIMKNEKVVNQIVEYIPTINFARTAPGQESVSLFETTIRYLGGLLSAYALSKVGGLALLVR